MFLPSLHFDKDTMVRDIVQQDYRAAAVFRSFAIGYCCGANWSLEAVCLMNNIPLEDITRELHAATRPTQPAPAGVFDEWDTPFLVQYIVQVHHQYLRQTFPTLQPVLEHFVEEHEKKYPELRLVQERFSRLSASLLPHLDQEEKIIFPYIQQVASAYQERSSYGGLFVKTLRKPIGHMMQAEHALLHESLTLFRYHTHNYTPPEKSCTSHRVVFARLRELDNNLAQHHYLENEVLFPRIIAMEKELKETVA